MRPGHLCIAIVDDDEGVRRALARVVRSLGLEPTVYASGEELLERISEEVPDAVLLDLHLPGIRGGDLIRALRRKGTTVPVIVMTGLDRPSARQDCLDAGALAYMTKPIRRAELAATLDAPFRP